MNDASCLATWFEAGLRESFERLHAALAAVAPVLNWCSAMTVPTAGAVHVDVSRIGRGASLGTLSKRMMYGGRKGRSAMRRIRRATVRT